MARIIVKSSFIRPNAPGSRDHLYNLVEYMATRPGVELVTQGWEQLPPTPGQRQLIQTLLDTMPRLEEDPSYEAYKIMPSMATASRFIDAASAPIQALAPEPQIPQEQRNDPATEKQQRLIDQLLKDFPDSRESLEYEDYLAAPTKGSASEFISHAMEENMFQLGSREAYVQYLAMRPGAERAEGHGLFSSSEEPPDLHEAANAIANHDGNVWTHIVSLRREDAEKLCMASAPAWQALLRSQAAHLAETMHIPAEDLRWYAAFHNEGHHPHIHMVAYSEGKEPYMGRGDIKKLKAYLAREIFRPELTPTYAEQTAQRNALTEQSRSELDKLISSLESGSTEQPELEADLRRLASYMRHHKGKAVYGYLPKQARELVNGIVDRLAQIPEISAVYDRWYEQRDTITGIYNGKPEERQPLSQNKAFRAVKNAVVKTAVELASGAILPTPGNSPRELPLPEIPMGWPDLPAPPPPETAEDFLALHPYPGKAGIQSAPGIEVPPAPGGEAPQDDAAISELAATFRELHPYPGMASNGTVLDDDAPPAPGDEAPQDNMPADAGIDAAPVITPPPAYRVSGGNMDDPKNWWSDDYKQARFYLYGSKTVQPDLPKAYAAMSALAKAGNPLAQCDLARMTMDGLSCDPDPEAAQAWYKNALAKFMAAEKSTEKNAYWQYRIGKLHAMGWGTEQDHTQSAAWYEKAAAQGNPFAAYALAGQYRRGQGVEQDDQKAFGLYLMAAQDEKRPNAYAMWELAIMCQNGIGTEADPAAAEQWYKDAYQGFEEMEKSLNDDKLWYRLGQMCFQGLGTEQDFNKAREYFEKAAGLKNANAYYGLGRLYATPECGFYDPQKSIDCYTKAAQLGHSYAAYRLGKLYVEGKEIPQDLPAGVAWLKMAVDMENPHAQYYLGKMYLLGREISADPAEGIRLLRLASDAGVAGAQYQMARQLFLGEYVAKDIPQALQLLQGLMDDQYFAPHAAYLLGRIYLSEPEYRDPEKAVEYLKQSAEGGNSYAEYCLGKLYVEGTEIPQDLPAGVAWLKMAVDMENPHAQYYLGKMYLLGREIPADPAEGIRLLRLASDAGVAGARYQMARQLFLGEYVAKDIPQALQLLQGLMDDQYFAPHAAYLLGRIYLSEPEYRDPEKAVEYLKQSAEGGNSYAEYCLGKLYVEGTEIPQDLPAGVAWLKMAVDMENPHAQYYLGKMYLLGREIPADPAEGIRLLRLASDAGVAGARYQMARQLYLGEYVAKDIPQALQLLQGLMDDQYFAPHAAYLLGRIYLSEPEYRDPEKAVEYLKQSAEGGNSYAEYCLGKLYVEGTEIPKDLPAGVAWLQKAVELDNPHAQYYLGKMYLLGREIPADPAEGIRLLRLASDAGVAGAQYQMARQLFLGEYVAKDIPQALKLLKGLMDDQYFAPHAAYLLGRIYLTEPDHWDPEKAVECLKKSAEAGNSYAEYSLGRFYLFGEGGSRDRELGMKYLQSAAGHGNAYAGHLIQAVQQTQARRAAHGTLGLLHHLEQIFRQRQQPQQPRQQGIERKLAQEIARKKQEHGQKLG